MILDGERVLTSLAASPRWRWEKSKIGSTLLRHPVARKNTTSTGAGCESGRYPARGTIQCFVLQYNVRYSTSTVLVQRATTRGIYILNLGCVVSVQRRMHLSVIRPLFTSKLDFWLSKNYKYEGLRWRSHNDDLNAARGNHIIRKILHPPCHDIDWFVI